MDSLDQVKAYAAADFSDANQRFIELVLAQLSQSLKHDSAAGSVLDLGCGPGSLTLALAEQLPGWRITGLDAGPNMLATAKHNAARTSADVQARTRFITGRLPDQIPRASFDLLVSNSLLHHLPEPGFLWHSLNSLAQPGAQVVVMDLFRPASQAALDALVDEYAGAEPEILQIDFANSLHAAWTAEEIRTQLDQAGLNHLAVAELSDRHVAVTGVLSGRRN